MTMSESSSSPDARTRIDLEAAAWLVKHDRGLSAAEQDEFSQWLAADSHHGEWFARHRRTWTEFNLLAQWRPEHSAEANPDLLARPVAETRGRATRSTTRARVYFRVLAAAASVALIGAVWLMRTTASKDLSAPLSLVAGYERRTLEDGSVVELNHGAQVTVAYSPGQRSVHLVKGEAQFDVARDVNRPFIVHARGLSVRALGTSFNVRLADREVEILVTEGKVHVDRPATPLTPSPTQHAKSDASAPPIAPLAELIAGQRTVVSLAADAPAPQVVIASSEDVSRFIAWQPQLLDFNSTPLREVLREFNRRNRTQLSLGDDDLGALPIVASFRSDNLEGFVRLLEITAQLRAEQRGPYEVVLRRAP